MPRTTGSSEAVVPVLDNTEDMTAPATILPIIRLFSPRPVKRTIASPIRCANPVWNIAAPTTYMLANNIITALEKPSGTSLIGTRPNIPTAAAPPKDVTAKGKSSVTKKKHMTAKIIRQVLASIPFPPVVCSLFSLF